MPRLPGIFPSRDVQHAAHADLVLVTAFDALSRYWRARAVRASTLAIAVLLGLSALVSVARSMPPIITEGDFALTELYTELAAGGRLFAGPYSRFGWHHPGPAYFYIQAPLYVLAGHRAASLFAGAAAVNVLALLGLALVIGREGGRTLLAVVTGSCVFLAWRAGGLLASPWTGHVPVLPCLTFAVLCSATTASRPRLLPVSLVSGALVAQTYVGLLPVVAALSGWATVIVVARSVKGDCTARSSLIISTIALLGVWLLPIIEAVAHGGGNAAALWHFFTAPAPSRRLADAFPIWCDALTSVWQPDFRLPWGAHFVPASAGWIVPCAVGQTLMLAVVAVNHAARRRGFETALGIATLIASATGLWAITRIRGDVLNHEIFWLAAFGALNAALIAAACLREVTEPWRAALPTWRAVAGVMCGLALVMAVGLAVRDFRQLTAFELRRTHRVGFVRAYESISDYVARERIRSLRLEIDPPLWGSGAAVVLRLYQSGIPFGVAPAWASMLTGAFPLTGDEDAIVTIAPRGDPGREGLVLYESGRVRVLAARISTERTP
jgi:hypothetical protein